jgi:predicted HicB family RNase H-like nuclease
MTTLRHRGYAARVEFDAEDRLFTGRIAGINDVVGFHGDSVDALEAAFRAAVDDYIETCAHAGKQPEREYAGAFMLRLPPEQHRRVALAAELAGVSLNRWAAEAVAAALPKDGATAQRGRRADPRKAPPRTGRQRG